MAEPGKRKHWGGFHGIRLVDPQKMKHWRDKMRLKVKEFFTEGELSVDELHPDALMKAPAEQQKQHRYNVLGEGYRYLGDTFERGALLGKGSYGKVRFPLSRAGCLLGRPLPMPAVSGIPDGSHIPRTCPMRCSGVTSSVYKIGYGRRYIFGQACPLPLYARGRNLIRLIFDAPRSPMCPRHSSGSTRGVAPPVDESPRTAHTRSVQRSAATRLRRRAACRHCTVH